MENEIDLETAAVIIDAIREGVTDIFVDVDCDPWSARQSRLGLHLGILAADAVRTYLEITGATVTDDYYDEAEMN